MGSHRLQGLPFDKESEGFWEGDRGTILGKKIETLFGATLTMKGLYKSLKGLIRALRAS